MKKRTVLITGGSRGIGEAIVKHLKKQNYNVIAPSRGELNLLDTRSIEKYIKKNKDKKIDILINNAGINNPQWIEELTDKNIEETIQINLISPIKLIRGFVGHMKEQKWGRVVNMSSMFGVVARGKQVMYVASKHGLNGVTKTLALELAQYNILVNSICPGFTNTELVSKKNSPERIAALLKDVPMGRLLEPQEIAYLVEFLISDKNTYITGDTIIIDGGFSSK